MKHLAPCLCAILLVLYSLGTVAQTQTPKPGHELVQTLLSLYRHAAYNTRQQAYLVSAGLPAYPEIVTWLRERKKMADAAEQTVINYTLAVITRAPEDIEAFLKDFPLDKYTYDKAFYPHRVTEQMVLQLQFFCAT